MKEYYSSNGSLYGTESYGTISNDWSLAAGTTHIELIDIEGTHGNYNRYAYNNNEEGIFFYYAGYDSSGNSIKYLQHLRYYNAYVYGTARTSPLDQFTFSSEDPYDFVMSGVGTSYYGPHAAISTRTGTSAGAASLFIRYGSSSLYYHGSPTLNPNMYTAFNMMRSSSYRYLSPVFYDHSTGKSLAYAYNFSMYYTYTWTDTNYTEVDNLLVALDNRYMDRTGRLGDFPALDSNYQISGFSTTVSYEYDTGLPTHMYVVNSSGNTFQLSTTKNGSPYTFPSGGATDYTLVLRPIPKVVSYTDNGNGDITFTFDSNIEAMGNLDYVEPSPVTLARTLQDYGFFSNAASR
jgi:hypothetical protein